MSIQEKDKQILRELAEKVAKIASLPIHKEKIKMWKSLNHLDRTKPMIWINEIPWHEMNVNDELTLKTSNEFCQKIEKGLRQTIYQWEHMRADMVVEPVIYSQLVINDSGFGISDVADVTKTDVNNSVVSRHFHPQILEEKDIEKIKMPQVTHDVEASEGNYQKMLDIFGGILRVEKRGAAGFWFAPWDYMIRWWGVEEALLDLVLKPELVHKAMDHYLNCHLHRLDQYEALNLLALNNKNSRIGSGGLGYTDDLPQSDYSPDRIRASDLWGCSAAQIFSGVSPEMHEEFALQYEMRWLKRFGLNYYGCCEPLHKKIGILKKIPNLRKISMSRWVNVEEGVANIGDNYVFSYKPNPSILAMDDWNPKQYRDEVWSMLEKTRGCRVEIIIKDISTVRYQPQRLWELAKITEEIAEDFA